MTNIRVATRFFYDAMFNFRRDCEFSGLFELKQKLFEQRLSNREFNMVAMAPRQTRNCPEILALNSSNLKAGPFVLNVTSEKRRRNIISG